MPLMRMGIRNFKRFESFEIDLSSDITVILGENSSGKSSILKGLLGVKQTTSPANEYECWVSNGEYVDLGVYRDYVNKKNTRMKFGLDLFFDKKEMNRNINVRRVGGESDGILFKITYDMDPITSQARFYEIAVKFTGEPDVDIRLVRQKTSQNYSLTYSDKLMSRVFRNHILAGFKDVSTNSIVTVKHNEKFSFKPIRLAARGQEVILCRFLNECLSVLGGNFEKNIFYLGPLRSSPSRSYLRSSHSLAVGPRGEHTPSALANLEKKVAKATRGVSQNRSDIELFRFGVDTVFPGYSVNAVTMEELVKLSVFDVSSVSYCGSNKNDVITDVGFGFSQVLPIIMQASVMPAGATLLIEQPELHLHPLAQTRLASFISHAARKGKRFVIETHSEHFVRGLQLAISNGRVSGERLPENHVSFNYIKRGSDASVVLTVNEWGEFEQEWPSGFFDESYNVIKRLMFNRVSSSGGGSVAPGGG